MPDFDMCPGGECPLRRECYRVLAIPSDPWQMFFSEPPYDKEKKSCDYFWQAKSKSQVRRLDIQTKVE